MYKALDFTRYIVYTIHCVINDNYPEVDHVEEYYADRRENPD